MRLPRIKVMDQEAVYHIYNHTVGLRKELPLNRPEIRQDFVRILKHYTRRFFCQLYGHSVLENHFHLKVRFEAYRPLTRNRLRKLASQFYTGSYQPYHHWNDEQWERFNIRLFDLSEFMRNLEQIFSKYYNERWDRQGPLWIGRFQSTMYLKGDSFLESLFYIELNPFRAGLVQKPELWREGSAYLRYWGFDDWLAPLKELFPEVEPDQVWRHYREQLLSRAAQPTKLSQAALSHEALEEERRRSYPRPEEGLTPRPEFHRSGVIGTWDQVKEWRKALHAQGIYKTLRDPYPIAGSPYFSLRATRPKKRRFSQTAENTQPSAVDTTRRPDEGDD